MKDKEVIYIACGCTACHKVHAGVNTLDNKLYLAPVYDDIEKYPADIRGYVELVDMTELELEVAKIVNRIVVGRVDVTDYVVFYDDRHGDDIVIRNHVLKVLGNYDVRFRSMVVRD